ncbi:MAG: corrinoid protein [Candidatus Hydrogenedentes bacterium]|nr:corrinoid protein [Candidatus Hydrogenedentota bacterium]
MTANKGNLLSEFKSAILAYDHEGAAEHARTALTANIEPIEIANVLTDALKDVGDAFGREEIYLPELILASRAGQSAMGVLEELLKKQAEGPSNSGKVALGTVKGDVHDIGKNIVATLFFANGFEVIDLGVDVSSEDFVEAVREHQPDIVGLSALLTTTMSEQKEVVAQLEASGLRDEVMVMVGGAPVTPAYAEEIGADGYGENAFDAIAASLRLIEHKAASEEAVA